MKNALMTIQINNSKEEGGQQVISCPCLIFCGVWVLEKKNVHPNMKEREVDAVINY